MLGEVPMETLCTIFNKVFLSLKLFQKKMFFINKNGKASHRGREVVCKIYNCKELKSEYINNSYKSVKVRQPNRKTGKRLKRLFT